MMSLLSDVRGVAERQIGVDQMAALGTANQIWAQHAVCLESISWPACGMCNVLESHARENAAHFHPSD